jgi:outer membrane murein-binding lipoprotein Lpp
MIDRRLVPFAALAVGLLLAGCEGTQQIEIELNNVKETTKSQMDIIKKQNELMNRKLNDINEKLRELQETNDRLSGDLAAFASRPEEIKLEIISEVNSRFVGAAKTQEDFKAEVTELFQKRMSEIEESMKQEIEDMEKTLAQHSAFGSFVAGEQDSINKVFASRFDSRPWYQSYIGKWEDMEKNKDTTP